MLPHSTSKKTNEWKNPSLCISTYGRLKACSLKGPSKKFRWKCTRGNVWLAFLSNYRERGRELEWLVSRVTYIYPKKITRFKQQCDNLRFETTIKQECSKQLIGTICRYQSLLRFYVAGENNWNEGMVQRSEKDLRRILRELKY